MTHRIGFFLTGHELLNAKTRDTNGFFMATQLQEVGIPVHMWLVSGDAHEDLLTSLHFLAAQCETIVMTGGLGPTSDDLTNEIVAEFLGLPVVFQEFAWEHCVNIYRKLGRTDVPESNRKQAYLPQGAELFENPHGTALGFQISGTPVGTSKPVQIFCLPGVPYEMEPMFELHVLPQLTQSQGGESSFCVRKTWQVLSMGESAMQSALQEVEEQYAKIHPTAHISYQARPAYVSYTAIKFCKTQAEAVEFSTYLEKTFYPVLQEKCGAYLIAEGPETLPVRVSQILQEKNLTLGVRNTLCPGALSREFVDIPGAFKFLKEISETTAQIQKSGLSKIQNRPDFWLAEISDVPQDSQGNIVFRLELGFLSEQIKPAQMPDLSKHLKVLGWEEGAARSDFAQAQGYVTFHNTFEMRVRYPWSAKQMRMANTGLGSLVVVLSYANSGK